MLILPELLIAAAPLSAWRDAAAAIGAALAAGSVLLGLWNYRPAIAETTLNSAAWWSAAATAAIAGVELVHIAMALDEKWLAPLRFCAAVLSFCPFVSVLGAKRPQHLAWNFVVLSLWGIVSLSALTALAMQRADRFVLGDARAWMLWAMILMMLINYLPTGNRLAALLVALGQVILFAPHLPLLRGVDFLTRLPAGPSLALFLFAIAVAVARTGSDPLRGQKEVDPFDLLWRDFRDSFGLLWGLRLQERVNAASTAGKWDVELQWPGFPSKGIPAKHREAVRQAMTGLLRRFVSHEWIAARLERGVD
ncbi:MAG: hypothetical protein K8R36_06720 [Planctomycetales bacterium]|nr:hypothetical protein [Planctomycetales bacterium]